MKKNNNDWEMRRGTHLLILFTHTFFTFLLIMESLLLGWENWIIPLLAIQFIFCWISHFFQLYTPLIRMHIYAAFELLMFFFYGVHKTSFYDLAPVMIIELLIYTLAGSKEVIYAGVLTYYFVAIYDLCLLKDIRPEPTILNITRLILHCSMILLGGAISLIVINNRNKGSEGLLSQIGELKKINQRTEEFLTNVSHELRTPINAVTGISTVLIKSESDPERIKSLMSIREAGRRLFDQIEDILDHTELRTGRISVQNENYMISSLVGDLYTEIRSLFPERADNIIFDIDPLIPSVLNGDVRKIKKILRHLIINSIKFTPDGCILVRIFPLPKAYGINLFIEVKDNGIGIAEDEIGRITERFYQALGGKSKNVGGLGLGLPIVHGLTTAMDGFFQIKSKKDLWTTAQVSIPQHVIDPSPCMNVADPELLKIVFYNKPESYKDTAIRDFYSEAIWHLAKSLRINLRFAATTDTLSKLYNNNSITHLFLGAAEYLENPGFFDEMTAKAKVIVATTADQPALFNERIHTVLLPFNGFSVVRELSGEGLFCYSESFLNRQMVCPYVRVLVVDDEPMNLIVAKGIFQDYRLIVETASSGKEALALCTKHNYDIIFLDHMMPEMDGIETMKRLRKENPERTLLIVALTANAVSGARDMFLSEGFDEFLSKPLDYSELERVLRKLLPESSITYVAAN